MASLRKVAIDDDSIIELGNDDPAAELAAIKAERDALLAQTDREREARLRSEGQLDGLSKSVAAERTRTLDTNMAASKAEADRIEQDIKAATEAADYGRTAALMRSLAQTEARLLYYERQKEDSERAATRRDPEPQPRGGDPVSAAFEDSIKTLAPRAQAWIRSHKEAWGTDDLTAAHWSAKKLKIAEGTDEYFRHLDIEMGYRKPAPAKAVEVEEEPEVEVEEGEEPEIEPAAAKTPQQQQPAQRRAAVAAPSSRDGTKMNGTNTKVRLTASQKQTADQLGQTYEQYWKNYQIAQSRMKESGRK